MNTSLPISNPVQESTYTTSAITSSSLTCSSQSTSPVTTTSSYDQTSVHNRIPYQSSMSPSDPTPVAVTVSEFQKKAFEKGEIFSYLLDFYYPGVSVLLTNPRGFFVSQYLLCYLCFLFLLCSPYLAMLYLECVYF